ncbi:MULTISPECIES: RAQPRD family integrative conjugative element protein [unclassified Pseudomonas]|uniref:integrative conjugative element protein, RAQPRD family n=1 Tax=unclassified Pseudomonas TaxID=196821 RepID=UPI000D3B6578|nr:MULTISPECIES: RAQPRD family integrative conjugative element protein [unclassified Pseudomonas]PTT12170.1 conjugal transfer protein [Pseudomonas sp. HMWF034]PVV73616.1 conjugal transfer protein [Pseudomonas sp. HMWF011]
MPTTVFRCLLLSLAIVHGSSYAASAHEQDQLSLIQRQLDTIERLLATRAEVASTAEPDDRYRFDYPRLIQDIQRIRQGIRSYLSPSRAQPRAPDELAGDYRLDIPIAAPSP